MRVVVAPDKFKGSLTAVQAADAMAAGVRDVDADADVRSCPVADGGEGTLEVLCAAGATRVDARVSGPLSDPVDAWYVLLDDWAYIESARACGIEHVTTGPRTALHAHTYGVGQLVAHALARGARGIVLTVGGTASTDGGAGMLRALGAELHDTEGRPVGLGGEALGAVTRVDLSGVRARLGETPVRVATDVTNPLLGPRGAASVFGPQKGAHPDEVARLEAGLRTWATALRHAGAPEVLNRPGAGAGGGLAGAAVAALSARVESGFDLVAAVTGVDDAIPGADVVITGEGSLDSQSLEGKAPAGVAARARRHDVAVLAVAGRVTLTGAELADAGIAAWYALVEHAPSAEYALRHAAALLRAGTAELLRSWLARHRE